MAKIEEESVNDNEDENESEHKHKYSGSKQVHESNDRNSINNEDWDWTLKTNQL